MSLHSNTPQEIAALLYDTSPLVVNPRLAQAIGLNEAIVYQQLSYWLKNPRMGVEHEGCRWVYNTLDQWKEQFPFWSTDTIKRTFASLQKQGLVLVEKIQKAKHDQTNYYTIARQVADSSDDGKLHSSSSGVPPIDGGNLHSSGSADCPDLIGANCTDLHPENTTKNTSENNNARDALPAQRKADPDDLGKRVLIYLNQEAGRNFQPVDANLKLIRARLKEGATWETLTRVIDRQVALWLNDPKMSEYLRPATLFNGEKFHQYLGSAGAKRPLTNDQKLDLLFGTGPAGGQCVDGEFREVGRV